MAEAKLKVLIKLRDEASKQMGQVASSFRTHSKAIRIAALAAGAAIVAMGIKSVKTFAAMGDEVQKMAMRTGFSTEALSELRFVTEQSGASLGMLEKAVKRQSKAIVDARDGMTTYVRAFDRIGLSAENLIKLKPEEAFWIIASAIAELESDTIRAATASDIFGRAGINLLPMLDQGADAIKRLREEAHELGIVFDPEMANSAAQLTDNMNALKRATDGLGIALGEVLAPGLIKTAGGLTAFLIAIRDLPETFNEFMRSVDSAGISFRDHAQIIEELKKAQRGEVNILAELIDQFPKLAERYKIQSTLLELNAFRAKQYADAQREAEEAGSKWLQSMIAGMDKAKKANEIFFIGATAGVRKFMEEQQRMAASVATTAENLHTISGRLYREADIVRVGDEILTKAEYEKIRKRRVKALAGVQAFGDGGVVPGPQGEPQLAIVHGQEEIRTPEQRERGDEQPIQINLIVDSEVLATVISPRLGEMTLRRGRLGG